MGRTAKTIVGHTGPILCIVSRFESWETQIGNFVMAISSYAGLIEHHLVHFGGDILIRHWLNTASNMLGERRSLMNLEEIEGQVLRSKRQSFIKISLPSIESLAWQSGNEIKINVLKSRIPQITKRLAYVIYGV